MKKDDMEIRCPRLGGEVTFAYCLQEGGELPCSKVIVCWEIHFPVEAALGEKLSPEQWERCFNPAPKDKVSSLVELIEAAKARQAAGRAEKE